MACHDAADDVGQVGLRVEAVELAVSISEATIAQCSAPAVGAGEEAVLAGERQRSDGAFNGLGLELDTAVVQEAGELSRTPATIAASSLSKGQSASP